MVEQVGSDFMIVTDVNGRIVARTDLPALTGVDLSGTPLVGKAIQGESFGGVWREEDRLYHAVSVPFAVGEEILGAVVTGYEIRRRAGEGHQTLRRLRGGVLREDRGRLPGNRHHARREHYRAPGLAGYGVDAGRVRGRAPASPGGDVPGDFRAAHHGGRAASPSVSSPRSARATGSSPRFAASRGASFWWAPRDRRRRGASHFLASGIARPAPKARDGHGLDPRGRLFERRGRTRRRRDWSSGVGGSVARRAKPSGKNR